MVHIFTSVPPLEEDSQIGSSAMSVSPAPPRSPFYKSCNPILLELETLKRRPQESSLLFIIWKERKKEKQEDADDVEAVQLK